MDATEPQAPGRSGSIPNGLAAERGVRLPGRSDPSTGSIGCATSLPVASDSLPPNQSLRIMQTRVRGRRMRNASSAHRDGRPEGLVLVLESVIAVGNAAHLSVETCDAEAS